jgi:hypothetical protein
MNRGIALAICFCLTPTDAVLADQSRVEMVRPTQQVPREGYKTWSLFLICTPDWVGPDKSDDLANLYQRFTRFGDAIGDDNLAVWFWRRPIALHDSKLSENIDVRRSTEYCRTLMLKPSEGPFLVVTNEYPQLTTFPRDRAVFSLGGLQPVELSKLLIGLTDQLLLQGKVDTTPPAASPAAPPSAPATSNQPASRLWVQLLEGARRSMIGFGCNVKMQVSAGILSAEVRGCPGP